MQQIGGRTFAHRTEWQYFFGSVTLEDQAEKKNVPMTLLSGAPTGLQCGKCQGKAQSSISVGPSWDHLGAETADGQKFFLHKVLSPNSVRCGKVLHVKV